MSEEFSSPRGLEPVNFGERLRKKIFGPKQEKVSPGDKFMVRSNQMVLFGHDPEKQKERFGEKHPRFIRLDPKYIERNQLSGLALSIRIDQEEKRLKVKTFTTNNRITLRYFNERNEKREVVMGPGVNRSKSFGVDTPLNIEIDTENGTVVHLSSPSRSNVDSGVISKVFEMQVGKRRRDD